MSQASPLMPSPSLCAPCAIPLPFSFEHPRRIKPVFKLACSLGALFDMRGQSNSDKGLLKPGAAYHLVRKHLSYNLPDDVVVELTLLSRLTPTMAQRVHHSLAAGGLHWGIAPLREALPGDRTSCQDRRAYIHENMQQDLILSARAEDVKVAVANGLSAVYVDPSHIPQPQKESSLRLAYDFDRAVAFACAPPGAPDDMIDNEEYTRRHGLPAAFKREGRYAHIPAHAGPIGPALIKHCQLRNALKDDPRRPPIEVYIVTARTDDCLPRVQTTLKNWDCEADDTIPTGPRSKGQQIAKMAIDGFFDDSRKHVKDVRVRCPRTMAGQIVYHNDFARQALMPYYG